MLNSFRVRRFATFEDLSIKHLGRVNLIVGKNNVGKTMLLEAIRLFLSNGALPVLRDILVDRDEVSAVSNDGPDERGQRLNIEALFHNWTAATGAGNAISLGTLGSTRRDLRIELVGLRRERHSLPFGEDEEEIASFWVETDLGTGVPGLAVTRPQRKSLFTIEDLNRVRRNYLPGAIRPVVVTSKGLTTSEIARSWDAVALRDSEARVIEFLQVIAPIERITLVDAPGRAGLRMPLVLLKGKPRPVPLRSLGDGTMRMFQFALAMEAAVASEERLPSRQERMPLLDFAPDPRRDTLLIDEIENGIHYSVLPELWRSIFRAARENSLQLFVTTHSDDCVRAFASVASEDKESVGTLIRLERTSADDIRVVEFAEDELLTATAHQFEVR
jgi:AAA domain, putative AbiEii toxin, Type IV TA system/AAA ATPase domain